MIEKYRTHYSKEIGKKEYNSIVSVAGWIEDIRNLGSIAFVILRDKQGTLQVTCLKKDDKKLFEKLVSLPRESVISVKGICKENEKVRNGYEILPKEVEILSISDKPLPMGVVDKTGIEFETRFDNRFIDLRKREIQAIFKIRDKVIDSAKDFLRKNDFIEVHTPKIIASASEGGTDLFKVEYFEKNAFLAQSPQLYKQMLMATGLDRVFEIAWYFRAEKHNTTRHLNESTAVDIEMAFINSEEEVMKILENMTLEMWNAAKTCKEELEILDIDLEKINVPFKRVTYDEVIELLNERDHKIEWGADFGSKEESIIGKIMEEKNEVFYFITKYPLEAKPFYTMPYEDMKYSRSFDLGCKGLEIASGSQRIHDKNLLIERIEKHGLNPKDFESYLKAFRYGMPPHGGFGFGIERFLMQLLKLKNIRECILFPRDRTRLIP
ncbi:MAG TPA: aspartate--tRNA(Asn) ligase [Thermoplasmatales archaeon]|nr:aspartate--tRNA(Asn) ligase [Thermoplasmatales archaeon]HEX08292.1 aspartate--tRNA(Asn) ligase [Thermoplasmatales archaeon]